MMNKSIITIEEMRQLLISASDQIIDGEPMLTKLDLQIGDGDHGIGMKAGFSALKTMLKETNFDDFYSFFRESGITLLRQMGGASGVIFCTMFIGGIDILKGKTELTASELAEFFSAGCSEIRRRGKAKPGQKTMVDALQPAADAMTEAAAAGDGICEVLRAGMDASEAGAEASAQMMPGIGRSRHFESAALNIPDPGAVSVSLIFKGIYIRYAELMRSGM
ncbi:MAG: dihydroxyacetone kinase subunit DhaL [Eubacteriales bacterium]|nr:dihydroxyacetone kinase subunit DhaL [Eubacteriales bacterium]